MLEDFQADQNQYGYSLGQTLTELCSKIILTFILNESNEVFNLNTALLHHSTRPVHDPYKQRVGQL